MPIKCKTCNHPQRAKIEKEIVKGAPSPNYRKIAKTFDVPYNSLTRHAKEHFAPVLEKAEEKAAEEIAQNIVIKTTDLHSFVYFSPKEQAMFAQHNLMLELAELNKTVEETDETANSLNTLKSIYGMGNPFVRVEAKIKVWREVLRWADYIAKVEGHYKNAGEPQETDKHKEFARHVHANALLRSMSFDDSLEIFLSTLYPVGSEQKPLREILKLSAYDIEKIREEGQILIDKQPIVVLKKNE